MTTFNHGSPELKEAHIVNCYNIIGDIHGRTCWQQLVRTDAVNIFVGDYFDPYEPISPAALLQNFGNIIAFKRSHPDTVLLYGNHDLHYLTERERCSRYDAMYAQQYRQSLQSARTLFDGVAFAAGSTLVSHAGVTLEWYESRFGTYQGESPAIVAAYINDLWRNNKAEFAFAANAVSPTDIYGESPTHSPLWVRPWTLAHHNLFARTAYSQVFGHTQVDDITAAGERLICIDCLGTTEKTYLLTNTN